MMNQLLELCSQLDESNLAHSPLIENRIFPCFAVEFG